ncbi:hypothetical protein Anas_13494 [Armadillidium nasatum]|uniref:Uncharacterized protein n=1 Tax=Armadillidium nasatum TaxID=96803 RepID=A0A5N5TFE3_9CRUS|nr:hypothetical protein Anas_13494 [Armadillidium nasatum]
MMVFEDTCSLGSAVSGQQSPEPSVDQCKPIGEETNSLGGGDKVLSSGSVLTGGRVCGGGIMGVAKSKNSRGRSSIFTLSRGTRGGKDNSLMPSTEGRGGSQEPPHSLSASSVGASSSSSSSSSCNPLQSVRPSRVSRPVTYRRPDPKKDGRRTTSLLNIFAASNTVHGNEREWSAPPQLTKVDVDENNVERIENEAKMVPHWPLTSGSLPTSPTKGGNSPTSPNEEDSTISRSLFRSSKCTIIFLFIHD